MYDYIYLDQENVNLAFKLLNFQTKLAHFQIKWQEPYKSNKTGIALIWK